MSTVVRGNPPKWRDATFSFSMPWFRKRAAQVTLGFFWPNKVLVYENGKVVRSYYERRQFYALRKIAWSKDCVDWLVVCWPVRVALVHKSHGYGKHAHRGS